VSIDKNVSSLNEMLYMHAVYSNRIKLESKANPKISEHLKVGS